MDVVNGFRSLKEGRIHLLCSRCGRKQSNSPRSDGDPKNASVVMLICDKHSGDKGDYQIYYDASGNELPDPYAPSTDN